MKELLLLLSILIPLICFANNEPSKVFVVLEIDNIIVDKILSKDKVVNSTFGSELVKKGFSVQNIEYDVTKKDPLFESYKNKKNLQFLIESESEDKIKISEMIVVRPSISDFIKEITNLKLPTHILICSKGNNNRVKNLINNLQLDINNKSFKDSVDFVSNEKCRVQIKSISSRKTFGKSAWQLRKKYNGKFGTIKNDDYVISIDQLPNHRFIYSNPEKDLNINLPPFYIADYNKTIKEDEQNMILIIKRIKDFIKK